MKEVKQHHIRAEAGASLIVEDYGGGDPFVQITDPHGVISYCGLTVKGCANLIKALQAVQRRHKVKRKA